MALAGAFFLVDWSILASNGGARLI
jgi:hypothetical protein